MGEEDGKNNKEFNDLKNHGYNIKYAYNYNENVMKVYIALELISRIIYCN